MKRIYLLVLSYLIITVNSYAQVLRGKLVDEKNEPLSEVTIKIKNSGKWTVSNQEGEFELIIDQNCATLTFSGVHIKEKEQLTCISDNVIIRLERRENLLDEVLIMGYTNTTKRYLVGSVTKIDGADIAKQAVGNPLQALHGRVPGMTVTMSSGLPGASVSIQVRGQNALKPDTWGRHYVDQPLFIIDGIPFSPQNDNINQLNSILSPSSIENPYGGFSPFNSIDPNSIESIEVLKDADATAIYGSRGGNGVVLITTKKGIAGKTHLYASFTHGLSKVGPTMPMMDTETYLEMRKEAFQNDNLTPNLTPSSNAFGIDLLLFEPENQTDWKDYFLGNTATNSNLNLTISGGNLNTKFLIGNSLQRQTYIYPGNFAHLSGSINTNLFHSSTDNKFSIQFSTQYSANKNNAVSFTDIIDAYTRAPNYPKPSDEHGNLVWSYKGFNFAHPTIFNPTAYKFHPYEIKTSLLNLGAILNYKVNNNLDAKINIGFNSLSSDEWAAYTKKGSSPFRPNDPRTATFGANKQASWILEPQLTYHNKILDGELNFLFGTSFQVDNKYSTQINTQGHLDDDLLRSITAAPISSSTNQDGTYKFAAMFSKLSFVWNEKVLTSFSFRRDGSSKFGPKQRFGNFGSIGLGWIFIENKENNILSFGKVRGTWGITGSDNTSPYQYITRWAPSGGSYNGMTGYLPQNLFNPSLSWAKTEKIDVGFDLGLFHDKLYIATSYYNNRTGNQLVNYRLPYTTGFNSIAMNWDALVENSGVEFSFKNSVISNNIFRWDLNANISIPKNKLLKFDGLENSSYSNRYIVGKSLNLLLGYQLEGVDPETGVFLYRKQNGELTTRPTAPSNGLLNDYVFLGNLDPNYFGGIDNHLQYKNFKINLFLEFNSKMGANFLRQIYSSPPGQMKNLPRVFKDRWQKPGDQARFMKVTTFVGNTTNPTNQLFPRSSGAYGDASYARLKYLSLSWSKNDLKLGNLPFNEFIVSFSTSNLFTFSDYEGNDPETLSFYSVPPLRSFNTSIYFKL